MADLGGLEQWFRKVTDLLPWRNESDQQNAHETLTEHLPDLLGRNATPAGVQKEAAPAETPDTTKDTFPVNTDTKKD